MLILLVMAGLSVPAGAMTSDVLEGVPIQNGGRKKPFVVFASDATRTIHGRSVVKLEDRKIPAMEFVLQLWLAPQGWDRMPVILVNHHDLKEACGLDKNRKFFSYRELADSTQFVGFLTEAAAARQKNEKAVGLAKEASQVGMRMAEIEALATGEPFALVPSGMASGPDSESLWLTIPAGLEAKENVALRNAFEGMSAAFTARDDAAFQDNVEKLASELAALHVAANDVNLRKIEVEQVYQRVHPFRLAWIAFLAAAMVAALTNWKGRRVGYAVAWILSGAGFLLLVAGLAARCYVAGRPPVTNMYESVIWVSSGVLLFGLIFEAIYKCRTYLYTALPVAVIGLILADTQPMVLDSSINPLEPVLRDNFWLTTHVLSITLSYAAFALALGIGHIPLGMVIAGRKPSAALYNYLYKLLQVGVLLLAIGTILGGVWANYSWGRFWDWDPKETWALIALLGYLFVLHGRIAGAWGGFGLAVGSVLGFLSVLMAWYGVNFVLGVGLHSYGFGSGGFPAVMTFVALDVAFVLFAIYRHRQNAA